MFDSETKEQNSSQQEQQPDQGSMFEVQGRQYDAQSAATKIQHADEHIAKLEKELADYREKLSKVDKLDSIEELLKQQTHKPEPQEQQPQSAPQAQINPDDIVKQVMETLSAKDQASIAQKNQEQAIQAAKSVYGDEYQQKLLEQGKAFGMDKEAIQSLAASNPSLFAHTFGLNRQASDKPSPTSTVNVKPTPNEQVKVSEVLLSKGSAAERTNFVKDALANPDKFLQG